MSQTTEHELYETYVYVYKYKSHIVYIHIYIYILQYLQLHIFIFYIDRSHYLTDFFFLETCVYNSLAYLCNYVDFFLFVTMYHVYEIKIYYYYYIKINSISAQLMIFTHRRSLWKCWRAN